MNWWKNWNPQYQSNKKEIYDKNYFKIGLKLLTLLKGNGRINAVKNDKPVT